MATEDEPEDAATSWRRRRWVACGLAGSPAVSDIAGEVGRMGCVQAQEFDMTLWSMSQRTGSTRAEILEALSLGEVVRTHAMRPTWHFIRRDDLALVQTATADRVQQRMRSMLRDRGVDDPVMERWQEWLVDLLTDGPMTRDEIKARLPGTPFRFDGLTLGIVLMWAELDLLVASGPPRGLVHTYQRLENVAELPDKDDAIRWVVERFLSSHGPSTVRDLCGWSSLTVTAVRRAMADLGADVKSTEDVSGVVRYWIGPLDDSGWPGDPTVELLNGFDEYISGLDSRSKGLLDPGRLYRQRAGTPFATVLVDGALAGHWRRTSSARNVQIEVQQLRALSGKERAGVEAAVERYATFAGVPAELVITDP